jgi:hypothetical protein
MKGMSDETVESALHLMSDLQAIGIAVNSLCLVRIVGGNVQAPERITVIKREALAELGKPLEWD